MVIFPFVLQVVLGGLRGGTSLRTTVVFSLLEAFLVVLEAFLVVLAVLVWLSAI